MSKFKENDVVVVTKNRSFQNIEDPIHRLREGDIGVIVADDLGGSILKRVKAKCSCGRSDTTYNLLYLEKIGEL